MVTTLAPKIVDLDAPKTDLTPTRRRFLTWGIYAVAGGITASLAVPTIGYFIAPALSSDSKVMVDIGKVSDLGTTYNQSPRRVPVSYAYIDGFKQVTNDATVYVEALKPNATQPSDFQVLSNICTHLGCALTFTSATKKFGPCGCHGSIFDHNGNVLRGPASKPLYKFEVTIEGDKLRINPLQFSI